MPRIPGRGKGPARKGTSDGVAASASDWRLPLWKQERKRRKEDRAYFKAQGRRCPTLKTAVLVELDTIYVPAWARAKAIRGLTGTADTIWTGRIVAERLRRLDADSGGVAKLTYTHYRRCNVCGRVLLGISAEVRLELDKKFAGDRTPCGPECVEVETLKRRKAA